MFQKSKQSWSHLAPCRIVPFLAVALLGLGSGEAMATELTIA